MSVLYIIATPIGNLDDITFRALETLKKVTLIAAEDTRRSLKLLTHYGVHSKLISCRAQNETAAAQKIMAALNKGDDVAYISDAGTPALSDPGAVLVRKVVEEGHQAVPIPGVSAFSALVSVAGAFDKTVIFEGFLSPKKGRRRARLGELLDTGMAFVLYESPFRILKLFSDLAELNGERYVCIGREMTKFYEEYLRGTVSEVFAILLERENFQGEFAVFVSGKQEEI